MDRHKVYKYLERHKVTSLAYYSILGSKKDETKKQAEELHANYKRELMLGKSYRQAEETLIWQFQRHDIHAILLSGTYEYNLYKKKEMGSIDGIEFFVNPKDVTKIHELMLSMDYEIKDDRCFTGLIYIRPPGIQIRFLYEIPNTDNRVQKVLLKQLKSKPCVQVLTPDRQYIYNICMLMEHYLRGDLTIRKILDFWLYRNQFYDIIIKDEVLKKLGRLGMLEWEYCLKMLGELWFGKENPEEDIDYAFALEEYILNPGKFDRKLDRMILPSGRKRLNFYERDREAEWKAHRWTWLFPNKEYMQEIFPIIKKLPFMIVVYWGIRDVRILGKVVKQKQLTKDRLLHIKKNTKE